MGTLAGNGLRKKIIESWIFEFTIILHGTKNKVFLCSAYTRNFFMHYVEKLAKYPFKIFMLIYVNTLNYAWLKMWDF